MVLLITAAFPGFAYVLVQKDGHRIELREPPRYAGGKATLALAAGGSRTIPEANVDKKATEHANAAARPKTFTNEDLAGAKGLSDSSGKVTVAGEDANEALARAAREAAELPRDEIVDGDLSAVKILSQVKPVYPPEAKKAGESGVVILAAIIDRDGAVAEATVLRSATPLLDQAAIDSVSQWLFEPPRTRVRLTVTVQFNIER